jgi:tRNA(Ile)-lysidine synthase
VTDETNLDDDYTRNYLRNSVIPRIKEVFPEVEKSILRLSNIAKETSNHLLAQAKKHLNVQSDDSVSISLPIEKPIFAKCIILALNELGVKKDWEKKHIDIAFELTKNQTGKKINLPFGVIVFKEDEKLVFQKETTTQNIVIPFSTNDFEFLGKNYKITSLPTAPKDLKDGLYLDLDKIPSGSVIRNKLDGDVFKVVNGKTKNLSDYLCEKKVPLRNREKIPLIAKESVVYAIFGLAVSEQAKIDEKTKNIIKIN